MKDAYELLKQARKALDHAEAAALLHEAVRQADLLNDEEAGFQARYELLNTAQEVGDGPTMLLCFSWLLNYADAHPEKDRLNLFWRYKWILSVARWMPNVPLERLHALNDDFEARTVAAGLGSRTANIYRWSLNLHMGDLAEAEKLRQTVAKQKSSWLDCSACDSYLRARHWQLMGELDKALKAAKPVLDGKQGCNLEPARTCAELVLPLWQAGRTAEAQDMYAKGYKLVHRKQDKLMEQSAFLAYALLSGQSKEAKKIYKATRPLAEKNTTPIDLLDWHAACALGLDALGAELASEGHEAKARAIASAFDARNSTGYQTQQLEELLVFRPSNK